jgi:hypothetical protein
MLMLTFDTMPVRIPDIDYKDFLGWSFCAYFFRASQGNIFYLSEGDQWYELIYSGEKFNNQNYFKILSDQLIVFSPRNKNHLVVIFDGNFLSMAIQAKIIKLNFSIRDVFFNDGKIFIVDSSLTITIFFLNNSQIKSIPAPVEFIENPNNLNYFFNRDFTDMHIFMFGLKKVYLLKISKDSNLTLSAFQYIMPHHFPMATVIGTRLNNMVLLKMQDRGLSDLKIYFLQIAHFPYNVPVPSYGAYQEIPQGTKDFFYGGEKIFVSWEKKDILFWRLNQQKIAVDLLKKHFTWQGLFREDHLDHSSICDIFIISVEENAPALLVVIQSSTFVEVRIFSLYIRANEVKLRSEDECQFKAQGSHNPVYQASCVKKTLHEAQNPLLVVQLRLGNEFYIHKIRIAVQMTETSSSSDLP